MNVLSFHALDHEVDDLWNVLQTEFGAVFIQQNWSDLESPPVLTSYTSHRYDKSKGWSEHRGICLTFPHLLEQLYIRRHSKDGVPRGFLSYTENPILDYSPGAVMRGKERPETLVDWFGRVDIVRPHIFMITRRQKGSKGRPDFVQAPEIIELYRNIRKLLKKIYLPMPEEDKPQWGRCSPEVVRLYREGSLAFHGITNERGYTYYLESQGASEEIPGLDATKP